VVKRLDWTGLLNTKPDTTSEELDNQEANLLLEIAREKRKVCHVQRQLADCVLREHQKIADLYHFKAEKAEGQLDYSELDVGWM
jgi:hypothetical protein